MDMTEGEDGLKIFDDIKILDEIAEILVPEKNLCYICNYRDEYIGDSHICKSCSADVDKLEGLLCRKCSKPLDHDADLCDECLSKVKCFERAVAPLEYKGLSKKLVRDYKYGGKSYLYKLFGQMLVERLEKEEIRGFDAIVPVPLHTLKMRTRGYNQSELIAKYISLKIGPPVLKLIIRTKKTVPQSSLTGEERWTNVKDAFEYSGKPGMISNILLVDDIYTTGATLNACASILRENGASKIWCATIAR
ncbi:comF family protein [Dethiosulfatibacter aminovorans DSM 17477]|uniref:ComF family protein n=1 Tax=Dethiosulfatibacter aminovorans DSM 17477 TaxID=1121476 RepID=A0A1M6JG46_9FIRM|nr:ComF family protein [Dethiosulfatibacter aminovorans]SHJ45635.1 comF family protein [Dethiosulfatibacter aminovorans DSM 17477]